MRLLITGAAGRIGGKLTRHFRGLGLDPALVDVRPGHGIIQADLAEPGGWEHLFAGLDAVLHLAATPDPEAEEAACRVLNVGLTRNVIDACRLHEVGRIVFASSLWTMEGYRGKGRITEAMPPRPVAAYGRSKLQSEGDLQDFGRAICLRLGWCPPDNAKKRALDADRWLQDVWLSDADLCQAFERAVETRTDRFLTLHVISSNAGSPWSPAQARRTIGYVPSTGIRRRDRLAAGLIGRVRRLAGVR